MADLGSLQERLKMPHSVLGSEGCSLAELLRSLIRRSSANRPSPVTKQPVVEPCRVVRAYSTYNAEDRNSAAWDKGT